MSKRSSKKTKRRSKALPALGLAGVSFSLASGACVSTGEASANTPPISQSRTTDLFLAEEEIFDVSLGTFYVYDKENAEPSSSLTQRLRLARGGCGGGCGCHGCGGGGGCHVGCGGGCRCGGGIHIGCAGGCHFGCRGCRCGGFFFGGCFGCGGCTASCWVWVPAFGWVYSCSAQSTPAGQESSVVASEQSVQIAEADPKADGTIIGARTK